MRSLLRRIEALEDAFGAADCTCDGLLVIDEHRRTPNQIAAYIAEHVCPVHGCEPRVVQRRCFGCERDGHERCEATVFDRVRWNPPPGATAVA